jgi:hypothetical protein
MADKVKHDKSMAANLDMDGLKALERWWIG